MARYAESLLTEGEQVVYRGRQHWLALFIRGRSALGLLALAIIVLILLAIVKATGVLQQAGISLVAILVIVAVVIFLYRWWQWANQDYVITNRRLLKVTGILNKHSADSSLEKINDAILDQPMFGRMFNYGDLTILTAAEEAVDRYHMLNDPKEFKKTMLTQKHALETEFMYVGAMPPTPPLRADAYQQPTPAAQPMTQPAPAPAPAPEPMVQTAPPVLPSDPAPAATEAAADVAAASASASDASLEVTQTLARLADLRDSGAITPEEYEAKKQELLGRL